MSSNSLMCLVLKISNFMLILVSKLYMLLKLLIILKIAYFKSIYSKFKQTGHIYFLKWAFFFSNCLFQKHLLYLNQTPFNRKLKISITLESFSYG